MSLFRYAIRDAYTLEELRREYENSDAKGRIRLLEKLQQDGGIPDEIARLAITDGRSDQNVEVRQWLARRGVWLRDDLKESLKNDPDPFVRACLRENPTFFDDRLPYGMKAVEAGLLQCLMEMAAPMSVVMCHFQEGTHLERLALVRNPRVSNDLIEKIFDPEDKELGIDLEQRKELVLAYLTNSQNPDAKKEWVKDDEGPPFGTSKHLSKLWRLISRWPRDVLGDDIYKFYRALPNPFERKEKKGILYEPGGKLTRLFWPLSEGITDADDRLRYLAYSKVDYLEPEEIKAVWVGNDVYALDGLSHNRSLYLASRLYEKLRPKGERWFPADSIGYAEELGAGNWISEYDDPLRWHELVKVLYDGVTYKRLHREAKKQLDFVGIFTDLRNHISYRLEEFYKNNDGQRTDVLGCLESRMDFDRASLDKEIEKVPPANPSELFGFGRSASKGNFLEEKIDYIGTKFLLIDSLIRFLYKAFIIIIAIYIGWDLLRWLYR